MSILALEWDSKELRGIEVDVSAKSLTVRRSFVATWPDDKPSVESYSAALRAACEKAGVSAKRAVICVPRDLAVTRHLELPTVPMEELATVVRYQTAGKAGVAAEELELDYLPQPPLSNQEGIGVLAATIPPQLLNRIRTTMDAVGIEIDSVTLAPQGIAELVQRVGDGATGSVMAISLVGERLEVLALEHGTLVFTYCARLTGDSPGHLCETDLRGVRSAVSRSLIAIDKERPGFDPAQVHVFANSGDHDELLTELTSRFEGKALTLTDPWREFVTAGGRGNDDIPADPSPFFGAAGAAFTTRSLISQRLNFAAPRKAVPKRDMGKAYFIAAAVAVVLLVAGAYIYRWKTISDLDDETKLLRTAAKNQKTTNEEGQPQVDAASAISSWQDRGVSSLEELARINRRVNTENVILKLLQISQTAGTTNRHGNITGDVMAKDRSYIEALNGDLDGESRFAVRTQEIRKLKDNEKGDKTYPFVSKLSVEVQPVVAKKDATRKSPRKPARRPARTSK